MILQIKFKLKFYRRFEKDIWGLIITNLDFRNKYLSFLHQLYLQKQKRFRQRQGYFAYDDVMIFKRKNKKSMKKRFVSLRLVKLYYVILSYRQLRRFASLAARQDGFFQENFCHKLENRLCTLIYRTNLVRTMFEAIKFVKSSNVMVNNFLKNSPNSKLHIGDLISIVFPDLSFLKHGLFSRLLRKSVYFAPPRYLFISYKFFIITLLAYPREKDLAFPMKFDIYRSTGYY